MLQTFLIFKGRCFLYEGGNWNQYFRQWTKINLFLLADCLTFLGYFVCFWVSRQTGVLYSFFWWLSLTNFWSRTRSLHTFGKLSGKWGKNRHLNQQFFFIDYNIYWLLLWGECERFDFSKEEELTIGWATGFCQYCIWLVAGGIGRYSGQVQKFDKADSQS